MSDLTLFERKQVGHINRLKADVKHARWERDELQAKINAVLELHRPGDFVYEYVIGHKFNACLECTGRSIPVPHPCDTAIAAGAKS